LENFPSILRKKILEELIGGALSEHEYLVIEHLKTEGDRLDLLLIHLVLLALCHHRLALLIELDWLVQNLHVGLNEFTNTLKCGQTG